MLLAPPLERWGMEPYSDERLIPLPSGDAGVSLTVSHLRQYVTQSQTSQLAHAAVQAALESTPEKHPGAEVAALLGWVRNHYRYLQDPVEVELVHDPRYLLRQIESHGYFMGDCDDAAVLLATLLETAGYPTRFLVQGKTGESFSHVLVEVDLSGTWTPIDLTNRSASVGWKPPTLGREARENRKERSMLGQENGSDPGALTDIWNANALEAQAMASASGPSESPAPASGGNGSSWFSDVFSPANIQSVLSIAERVGAYKPIVGYDLQGRPQYAGQVMPASGPQAAFTTLTQPGPLGVPLGVWIVGGVLVAVVVIAAPRRRSRR